MFGDDDIYWDYESSTCIVYQKQRDRFYSELKKLLTIMDKNFDLNKVDLNNKEVVFCKDVENFRDFCIQIYWYGRRKKAWKLK
jgi:hypothetical protein